MSKTELPEEGTVDVDIGAIRQNILNDPNLAQKLDIGERLEVPAEGGEVPTGQLLPTDENEFPDFAFDENGNVVELDDEKAQRQHHKEGKGTKGSGSALGPTRVFARVRVGEVSASFFLAISIFCESGFACCCDTAFLTGAGAEDSPSP